MSINFSEETTESAITTARSLPEDQAEGSLRPRTLTEYIGQEKAKGNLEIFINAAKICFTAPRVSAKQRSPRSLPTRWA